MYLGINNDNVWDPLQKGAEIALELIKNNKVVIDLNGESPAIESTVLPQLFDFLESQGIDLKNIVIETGNPVEQYNKITVRHIPESFYEIKLFQKYIDDINIPTWKNIKYHFGNFVSRTSVPRLVIASHLYTNYQSQTLQTFHYDWNSNYHKTHLDLDGLLHTYGPNSIEFDEAVTLLKNSPILKEEIKTYPILHVQEETNNLINICKWYEDIFVDVICETWYTGNNFYITEKFWRAVATKTPFIIQGSQDIMMNLRRLGFKTFEEFWDEGYSEDPYPYNISEIKKVLKYLSEKPIDELNFLYKEMRSILDHNYEMLKSMDCKDIEKKLNE